MLTFDINAHAAVQGNWALCYEQLYGGSFRGELTMVQLDGLRLFGEKTNLSLRQRGRLNPLWESMYQKPLAAWLERQVDLLPSAENVTALGTRHLQALQIALALAQDFPDASSRVKLRDDILIEWIEALPPSVDTSDLDSLARRKRMVDKACELMMANPDQPPSILDLCSRVGASRRKLNYCFQDVLGTSPTQYLRALRLNGVRRSLRQAGHQESVQDVATRWGFWHQGQFSLDYKKHFFELPSETLARSRRPRSG